MRQPSSWCFPYACRSVSTNVLHQARQHCRTADTAQGPHQKADTTLVVRAGLRDVAVLARVASPRVLMWVRVAALLPWVRGFDWTGLDLHAKWGRQLAHGSAVLLAKFSAMRWYLRSCQVGRNVSQS